MRIARVAPRLLVVLAAGCAPTPPLAGPEPDLATPAPPPGEILGEPWIGAPEKTETVAEMMARQTYPKLPHREEFEVPRDNLRQNPDAPSLPRWPPTPQPAKPAHGRPPAKPELPQMPSLSFTGESSAVDALNFAPPDSMGAIGPSQFLFFSNGMIRTYSRLGALDGALNTTDDNFFLSVRTPCTTGAQCSNSGCPADGHCQSTDPRVFYDRQSQHWFLVQIDIASVDRVLIAWTSDTTIKTTTVFHFFQFEHDLVGSCGTDCGGFFDQPTLGVDNLALYIGGDVFNSAGTWIGTTGFVVNKAQLLAGTLMVTPFRQLASQTTAGPTSPKGVSNDNPASTEGYFIGADAQSFGTLSMRRVSTPGGTPSISQNIAIAVNSTQLPLPVPSIGGNTPLDAIDDRLISAEMRSGSLWAAHQIEVGSDGVACCTGQGGCTVACNGTGRDGVRWYQIINLTSTPTRAQEGTVFDSTTTNNYFWMGSIVASGQGHVAIGASYAGANSYAGVAFSGRLASDALGTERAATLIPSNTSYNYGAIQNGAERWGDYSFTSVDPNDNMTMWTAQEFCDNTNSWAVKVTKLLAPLPTTPTSASPLTLLPGTTNTVTLTGTSVSGSADYDPGAGFPNHMAVTCSCAGVTVNSVTLINANTLSVNLTIASGAPTGLCTFTVTNPDGQQVTSGSIFGIGKGLGASCTVNSDCANGICATGFCCQTTCTGNCATCSGGTCQNRSGLGSPLCSGNLVCSGTSATCPANCGTSDALCAAGYYCNGGVCTAGARNVAAGGACTHNAQCVSDQCNGAVCTQPPDWSTAAPNVPSIGGTVSPSNNVSGDAFFATGNQMNGIVLTSSGNATPVTGSPFTAAASIENFPEVVQLNDGHTYVFFTSNDGYLYKVDAATMTVGVTNGHSQLVNLKRAVTCNPPDVIQASPAVQLAAYSSTAFKNKWGATRNLVYVITYHGCGDSAGNQVIALDADDITLAPVWSFTGGGSNPAMDYGSEGCYVDYGLNLLYCGTNLPAGSSQPTVWAFDTVAGALSWSVALGASVHNRPQLLPTGNHHLFVADMNAVLHALNPMKSGSQDWSFTINSTPGAYVANDFWVEWRTGPDVVIVTDSAGLVTAVTDNGTSGTLAWRYTPANGAHAVSPVSVAPTPQLAFVGFDDGTVHEINFTNGADVTSRLVLNANAATGGNLVCEPTFALVSATDINKMVVSSEGNFGTITRQFPVPLQ